MIDTGARPDRKGRRRLEQDQELNLVPMLDLFLSLIPFLLASAVLINYGSLFVEAPSYSVAQKQEQKQDQQKDKIELDLAIDLVDGKIKVIGYHRGFERKVDGVRTEFALADIEKFRSYLIELQTKYGKIHSSLFHASPNSKYEEAIVVINAIRATESSESLVLAVGAVQ